MGKDFGLNLRSTLSQGVGGDSAIWDSSQIDSINSVFQSIQIGHHLGDDELDTAVEQLAKGLGRDSLNPQVQELITDLYNQLGDVGMTGQQGRVLGALVAPDRSEVLQNVFDQQVGGKGIDSLMQSALLNIAHEPNLATRMIMLSQLISRTRESGSPSTPSGQQFLSVREGSMPSSDDRITIEEDQESKISHIGDGGVGPEGENALGTRALNTEPISSATQGTADSLSGAVAKNDFSAIRTLLMDANQNGTLRETIGGMDSESQQSLKVAARQLLLAPSDRQLAMNVLNVFGPETALHANDGPKMPPIMHTGVIDTSRFRV